MGTKSPIPFFSCFFNELGKNFMVHGVVCSPPPCSFPCSASPSQIFITIVNIYSYKFLSPIGINLAINNNGVTSLLFLALSP
jgi:hypothetical protein